MPNWLIHLLNDFACWAQTVLQAELTSTFAVATVSALAGAWLGAYAAQRIAENSKIKDDLILEIRSTNAGIAIAFDIFQTNVTLKDQLFLALKNEFDTGKERHEEFLRKLQIDPQGTGAFEFVMDFQEFSPAYVPIEKLQEILFEKLSVVGKPLSLASVLMKSNFSLTANIEGRNQLINAYRSAPLPDDIRSAHFYFGTKDNSGHRDRRYSDFVESIYQQNDSCIMFCKMLIEELYLHGVKLKKIYEKRYRGTSPRVTEIDFSSVKKGLIPSEDDYRDWIENFKKQDN